MRARRKKPKTIPGPPYVPCGMCCGGWVYKADKVGDYVSAGRCWCFHAHQRKLAQSQEKGT